VLSHLSILMVRINKFTDDHPDPDAGIDRTGAPHVDPDAGIDQIGGQSGDPDAGNVT